MDRTGRESRSGALPQGSVVPGADIWDDDDDVEPIDFTERLDQVGRDAADEEWDDQSWLQDAQVVAHVDDDGVHDGSRGVEADDDETTEAFGTKMQRWGTSSMLGVTLSGVGFGIQKVLDPRESAEVEIRVDDDTDDRLDPIEVKLGDDPADAVAFLRPWLQKRDQTDDPGA